MPRLVAVPLLIAAAIAGGIGTAGAQMNASIDLTKPNYANSPLPTVVGNTITGGIRKFVDSLPGLGPAGANNLGQYIPVATKVANPAFPNDDYYEIGLVDYTQKMHSDLPATKLRGYKDLAPNADGLAHYLGPLIVAQRNRPVRVKFVNQLGTGAAGKLPIPVDTTLMGAGTGPGFLPDGITPSPELYTQNRADIHLHGGITPWISDGTPHQWITPAGETTSYPVGVSKRDVPDMAAPGDGAATYYFTNQQSARMIWYHDHSLGITRLNVYAGEVAGYVLRDPAENDLVNRGVIPTDEIPLIIQDKSFVSSDATNGTLVTDPTWATAVPNSAQGDLWYPHVYMPNQNPNDPIAGNPMGRWDYGPWFWPVFPVQAPMPAVSIVPEAFMDTAVVNGCAYPYIDIQPKAYRFRILNGCNDRSLNLQLYISDPAYPAGTEVKMVTAAPNAGLPATWPTDGRDGGVPDPALVGPNFIQIGNESGFLPAPTVVENCPIGYDYNRRNVVVLNVLNKALLLGPAERADVIVDFSGIPSGSKVILYNDSPAPTPASDPRYDYYTGNPDLTANGGAPSTLPGYGPNTRTLMQFRVSGTAAAPYDLAKLQQNLPAAYAASQEPRLVPQVAYGDATDTIGQIQDNSLTFTPIGANAPVTMPVQNKAIQELFDPLYGRMNATLGYEQPFTNALTQTTIPLFYIDPPIEMLPENEMQIWKITHNGVDTHTIHFHLVDVQVINRVGWDGAVRMPDPNELGYKESVRMNPLEDIFLAVRPRKPLLPFGMVDSIRPLDPTQPIGTQNGFTQIAGQPNVTNQMANFGWEYVWHCHLLGHEENDMMRPLSMIVTAATTLPTAPSNLTIADTSLKPALSWKDNSNNEDGFRIERYTGTQPGGVWALVGFVAPNVTSYTDTLPGVGAYTFRIVAYNAVGTSTSNKASVAAGVYPTSTGACTPTPNAAGWNNTNVTVSITTTDPSGSGIANIKYQLDANAVVTVNAATASLSVTTEGVHTLKYHATDRNGGIEPDNTLTIRIDKTRPTLTWGSVSPVANLNGWNNSAVSQPYIATDALSGVASATPGSPLSYTTDGAGLKTVVTVTDLAGNSQTFTSATINLDTVKPTITATPNPAAAASGWYLNDVTVNLVGADAGSNIASVTYSATGAQSIAATTVNAASAAVSITTEGTTTLKYTATDKAGNVSDQGTMTIKLDKTVPVLTWGTPVAAAGGGYDVPFTVTDAISGLKTTSVASPLHINTGVTTGTVTATDNAGNSATYTSPAVGTSDVTPPTVTATLNPAANAAGWNKANLTVGLAATDNAGGSGVASITYTATGARAIATTTVKTATASFGITVEGTTTVTYFATDKVGNASSPRTLTVKLDKTAPGLTWGAKSPAANAGGWNKTSVSLPFTATDAGSGVASATPSSPLVLSTEGAAVTGTVTVVDAAGNSKAIVSAANKIDKTAPTLTASSTVSSTPVSATPVTATISGTLADTLSTPAAKGTYTVTDSKGIASSSGTYSVSAGRYTFNLSLARTVARTYTIVVTGLDKADNTATRTLIVTVQ